MVAPSARDLEVPRRVAFESKAETPNQCNRARVLRLNVRLESMQAVLAKCQPDDLFQSRAHVPTPVMWNERVVPEVAGAERPADDLVDVDDPGEQIVFGVHEMAEVRRLARSLNASAVLL